MGGYLLVSSVPMVEQSIDKHTLSSVHKLKKIDTIFTVSSKKNNTFHYVIRKSTPFHSRH